MGPSAEATDSASTRTLVFFFFFLIVSPLLTLSTSLSIMVLADFLGAGNLLDEETCMSLTTDWAFLSGLRLGPASFGPSRSR